MLKINPDIAPQIEMLGEGQCPLIIIDDYLQNIDVLTEHVATNAEFSRDGHTQYPGIRSPIAKEIVVDYLKPIMQAIYKVYGYAPSLTPAPCDNFFSLITTMPNALADIQTIPHFDTYQANLIAVIHYLNDKPHGGIGFFRHKTTGYEFINALRKPEYDQLVLNMETQHQGESHKVNANGYCSAESPEFECYKTLEYKANRLMIFPGMLLHSSLIDVSSDIDPSPITGRLTANMFIKFV